MNASNMERREDFWLQCWSVNEKYGRNKGMARTVNGIGVRFQFVFFSEMSGFLLRISTLLGQRRLLASNKLLFEIISLHYFLIKLLS